MRINEFKPKKEYVVICVVIAAILIISVIAVIILLTRNTDDFSLNEQCLEAHNEYRSQHDSPPLQKDSELIKTALKVAKSNVENRALKHSEYGFGENLYEMKSSAGFEDFNCELAVSMWHSEYKDYDFRRGDYIPGTGHFTQLVWKSSKFLGCASATSNDLLVVACEYKPSGNVIGAFTKNVQSQT